MPISKSRHRFRSGRKLRESFGPALLVRESFLRLSWSERVGCHFRWLFNCALATRKVLHKTAKSGNYSSTIIWGRTGFDSSLEAQAACRGWSVGLVKNRTKQINADNEGL